MDEEDISKLQMIEDGIDDDDLEEMQDFEDDEYEGVPIEDLECTHCSGDGWVFGDELGDPLYYLPDETYPCEACNGTGDRKHQTVF